METRQAIISFSQSEKVKSGLIWCTQCAHILQNMPNPEMQGGLRLLQALIAMLGNEVQVARQASGDPIWLEVERHLNNARVMVDSGVGHEADFHLTHALSQVNRIGQKSMTFLVEKGLV
ncbi:MAG: hypothetical protein M0036_09995 [Desulfobacteraceae bacterium]|nr:hypothetical protein [Desulfobacteraceae bacterium]